ncbi:glutamate receptor 2-like [Aricia agestis]|uniref:glutamate receptor 2-like n=1 Tax=Aricia agestis TaxID=91739 RepID=UPI001C20ABAB|nr:glutamate receptor 2-like [Aricia agestis]
MNMAPYDWLILARSVRDFDKMNDILNATAIRFDQNIVVAYPDPQYKIQPLNLCKKNFVYSKLDPLIHKKRNNVYIKKQSYDSNRALFENSYYRTSLRFLNITRHKTYKDKMPLLRSGVLNYNYSREFQMTNISQYFLRRAIRTWSRKNNMTDSFKINLLQYFKLRTNTTLFASYLGAWSTDRSMSLVDSPYPVEARQFMGERLVVGRCNATEEKSPDEDTTSSAALMDDVLQFLSVQLNATSVTRYYSKLGFRTYEGAWTGLLGALMDNSADIALEAVTALSAHHEDMDFVFPIAETMCNIYIRHQETSAVRDIFLAPFSPRLIACVLSVALAASVAIVIISRLTSAYRNVRHMSCGEALIWATGILCQQGGTWTPQNPAASIVLIVCLLFAVVIFNAYAAFITSVLSVRVASVGTVADVLHSPNLKIGYVRNGVDQMYLMSTKDSQLNAFYIRGYSEAENLVSTAEEGLARAASQDYAFFAGQQVARHTIRSLSQARGRCALRELPVHSTRADMAFPLPRHSPYSRPILVSLLRLRSGGALARLAAALVPSMPQCTPSSGFASARAADVRTALFILLTGLSTAVIIGIGEYTWRNRKKYRRNLGKCFNRMLNLVLFKL